MSVPRVVIRGLEDNADKEEIRHLFEKFGRLTNVWIATKPPGFAYVFYKSFNDAEKAVDYYNGKEVCGMTVSVELSPVEDRNRRQDRDRLRRDRSLEDRREKPARERRSSSSYSDESGSERYYSSDPDAKHDYEREKHREGEYRHHRSSRDGHYSRENSSYQGRGRPYNYYGNRGRGRGYYSNYQDRGDNRRHSFTDRRGSYGRGRGWIDNRDRYNDGGYRPRGRGGRSDYGDSSWSRGRGRGGSSNRFHNTYTPRYHDRGGFRPRDGRKYGNEQYDSHRGRGYKETSYHHRSRSESDRYSSPPPQSRHHEQGSNKPPMDSEFVAKMYKMKQDRNGGESSRVSDSRRHSDMEYRQSRKPRREEVYARSGKDFDPEESGYDRHSSRKEHHRAERHSGHHHPGKRQGMDEGHYRKKEHSGSKRWEAEDVRDRSPLSPRGDRYMDPDESPLRSRSRSVSSQSSDTSRGPSASPSPPPPRHKHARRQYRSPSRSVSRTPSPGGYSHELPSRHSSKHELMSPPQSPVFEAAQGSGFFEVDPGYQSPLYSPAYKDNSPYAIPSPKRGRFEDEHLVDDKMVEYELLKQQGDYKSSKRDVRNRERQVVVGEKYGKERFIEVDAREVRHEGAHVSRPLSESFDLVGSAHSSKHSSPQERRPHSDLKRRHSAHKEYGMSRRHVQKSSPMSERMMKGH